MYCYRCKYMRYIQRTHNDAHLETKYCVVCKKFAEHWHGSKTGCLDCAARTFTVTVRRATGYRVERSRPAPRKCLLPGCTVIIRNGSRRKVYCCVAHREMGSKLNLKPKPFDSADGVKARKVIDRKHGKLVPIITLQGLTANKFCSMVDKVLSGKVTLVG